MGKAPYPLAEVEWLDAHQQQDELTVDNILEEHKPAVIHTQGYIIINDEVGVWVASEWLPGNKAQPKDTYRQHTFIPKGMLKKITYRGKKRASARRDTSSSRTDSHPTSTDSQPVLPGPSSDVGGV